MGEETTMVAGRAARGLSEADLDHVRRSLAGGRRPKVVFTAAAGQLAGQTGQVVELADPAASDEWLMVRFGRDTLPFSPADLALPAKARPPRGRAARAVPVDAATPAPPPSGQPPSGQPPSGQPPSGQPPPGQPRPGQPPPQPRPGQPPPGRADRPAPQPAPAHPADSLPAAGAKPARRPARAKPPSALAVTLSYGDGRWTVGAQQGGRVLAKPSAVRATDALRMVALLDVPAVQQVVAQIVAAARADAERAADRLRAELAEVEARLAELPDGDDLRR